MDYDPVSHDLGENFEGLDSAKKRDDERVSKKLDNPGASKYAQAICNHMFECKTEDASLLSIVRITYGVLALDERSPEESVG